MIAARNCDMWFGTKEYAGWIPTPLSGAGVSPEAWTDSGTFINGGGYGLHSYNSHKTYDFSWRKSSSREMAQLIKSYFDGTYGRGKIYFHDPLTYDTNVLPARWADPSITVGFEGPSLVEGVEPRAVNTENFRKNRLPVKSAFYDLQGTPPTEISVQELGRNYFTDPYLRNTVEDTILLNHYRDPTFESMNFVTTVSGTIQQSTEWSMGGSYSLEITGGSEAELNFLSLLPSGGSRLIAYCYTSSEYDFSKDGAEDRGVKVVKSNPSSTTVYQTPEETGVQVFKVEDLGYTDKIYLTGSGDPGQSVFWSLITVTRNRDYYEGLPFSGDSESEGIYSYSWEGVPHNSRSNLVASNVYPGVGVGADVPLQVEEGWIVNNGGGATFLLTGDPTPLLRKIHVNLRDGGEVTVLPSLDSPQTITSDLPQGRHWLGDAVAVAVERLTGAVNELGFFDTDYVGEYFTGDTPNTSDVTYYWDGVPGGSESVKAALTLSNTDSIPLDKALYIPIPEGMDLHVGAFFEADQGAGIFVSEALENGEPSQALSKLTALENDSDTLFNTTYSGVPGVYLWIGHDGSGQYPEITITAMHARLTRTGSSVKGVNYWLGGQGHNGVRFAEPPSRGNPSMSQFSTRQRR